MQPTPTVTIELVLSLILALAIIAAAARLARVPPPLAFIAGGIVMSLARRKSSHDR